MTLSKLPGLQGAFMQGAFYCAGIHNFFPSPLEVMIDAPDCYEFTSHRLRDRERALELSLKSLEYGAKFGARYMVVHMGSVPMNPKRWTKKWTAFLKDKGQEGYEHPRFMRGMEKFRKKRKKLSPLYLQRALDSLEILADKALELGIRLGVESRSRFEDVPSEEEMRIIQTHFKDHAAVGYWHDFGHVQLKHNLGLLDHAQWLEEMRPYLIGCHVHDVYGVDRDHRVPLTGQLDFSSLLSTLDPSLPYVWELSPTRKREEICAALEVWQKAFAAYC